MHCPECGHRLPKDDKTICPHCGKNLFPNNEKNDEKKNVPSQEDEEAIKRRNALNSQKEKEKEKKPFSWVTVFGLLALVLILEGIITVYAIPYPNLNVPDAPLPPLLVGGEMSLILGVLIILVVIVPKSYSMMFASRKRLKRGEILTVYDAMSMRVYYPAWMKWWYPLIPLAVFLLLGEAGVISLSISLLLFFGYGGIVILYQYLYARMWLAKRRSKQDITD